MAEEFVEANVFQVPNLVGAANQQQRVKKQEQFRTLGYLDKYQRRNGKYLPGHQPLVQDRWDDVVKRMDAVAANDNVANRRALTSAYTAYGQTAGNAQFVAQEYANERKYLSENANKLAISVADADAQLNNLSNQAVNEMQLAQLATDPMSLRLPRGYVPGKVKDYATQGRILLQSASPKLNNEWLSTGKLDLNAASKWADEWGSQNYTKGQEDEMIAQVLVSENIKGRNGKLTIDEFAQIQGMPEEDRNKYVSQYIQSAKDNFLRNLPRTKKVSSSSSDGSSKLKIGSVSGKTFSQEERNRLFPSYTEKDTRQPGVGNILNPSGERGSTTKGKKLGFKVANLKSPLTVGDGSRINSFGYGPDGQLFVLASEKAVPELTPREVATLVVKNINDITEEDYATAQTMKMDSDPTYKSTWQEGNENDLLRLKGALGDKEWYQITERIAGQKTADGLYRSDYNDYIKRLEQNNGQVVNKTTPDMSVYDKRARSGEERREERDEEIFGGKQQRIF